jgi:hypothetical protein
MPVELSSIHLPLSSFYAQWTSGAKSYPDAVPEKREKSTHPGVPPRKPICSSSPPSSSFSKIEIDRQRVKDRVNSQGLLISLFHEPRHYLRVF